MPLTADDLGGYAAGLYRAALAYPELVRLTAWARLEGVATPAGAPGRDDKLEAIAEAQRAGLVTSSARADDVLALVTSMALTWSDLGGAGTENTPAAEHDRREQTLAEAVRRAFHC
ncbi:hypothetical protein [Amycolatopsis sp. GM8]|uniref:hypothetical protein n=1 Tax=Amycolatopsis sp. GM8 TaxID=2896530 RepID=UPI001F1AD2A8|nr:hypothetical protein [Amycolatopsis sp. GM8]